MIFSIMLGVVLFFLGINFAYPIKQVVDTSRAEGQLNCSTVTEYQDKANCVIVDFATPLIVGLIFGIAGFLITRSLT